MAPPPLLGYNNNVRHRGRIFHIQTEDSGVNSPRIMTHLFADGGRIVKSTRTDYSEHLERSDMVLVVKEMMKEQHKAMFVALRSGELDETIGFDEDAPPNSVADDSEALGRAAKLMETAGKKSDEEKSEPRLQARRAGVIGAEPKSSGEEKAYAVSRPAAIFSVPPPAQAPNIFGAVGGLDEKSLDDAILSYLAEDPDDEDKPKSGKKR